MMKDWFSRSLSSMSLSEDAEAYLLIRGAKPESISRIGAVVWSCPDEECSDPYFAKKYGSQGQLFDDRIIFPYLSPKGDIIGLEARSPKKFITDVRSRRAKWNPVWIGLDSTTMKKIWGGARIWIVEGVFDLFAMEWAVPSEDVVLASVTAKLSWNHSHFLRRFCSSSVNIVYDLDNSGREGASKAVWSLNKCGVRCKDIPYTGGKDPGEIWKSYGKYGLKKAFQYYI